MTNGKEPEKSVGICQCGKPLFPVYNSEGRRIGVSHNSEDEDYHNEYFSNLFNTDLQ